MLFGKGGKKQCKPQRSISVNHKPICAAVFQPDFPTYNLAFLEMSHSNVANRWNKLSDRVGII